MNPEEFFNSLVDYEKIPGYDYKLEDFIEFLTQFDLPQKRLNNVIHIAGTKGKGSTAAMISSCLESCGYRVGLFTSPHLNRINERIKINDLEIPNRDLMKYIKQIRPYINGKHRARTFFEVLTTITFLYFLKKQTDFSILEVGMGGRLDSTNVTNPIISVITKIGYDHTSLLGKTLSRITREKAGIIKNRGKLITIRQRPTVQKIIEKKCWAKSCSLSFAEDQHNIKIVKRTIKGSHVRIVGQIGRFNAFLPLPGIHQVQNLVLALSVINELRTMGFEIPVQAVQKGIRQTKLRGRFEVISNKPLVIFDCAHNRDSFEALHENIETLKIRNFFLIFGCSRGKDITYALRKIFPKAKEVVLVKTDNPRAMLQTDIYSNARKYQENITIASSVAHAIEYLKSKSQRNEKIIITGSFYLWQPVW